MAVVGMPTSIKNMKTSAHNLKIFKTVIEKEASTLAGKK